MDYFKKRGLRAGKTMSLLVAIAFLLFSCSEDDSATDLSGVLSPGEVIPLGVVSKIVQNGTYEVPNGAEAITTFCTGRVSITVGSTVNTCESDGSSNQTNLLNGVASVDFELGTDAYAEVILR